MDHEFTLRRRIFFLTGWGRFLCHLESINKDLETIVGFREKGRWGVLVNDDYWALQYQRLYFRICRAKYAVGSFGLKASASYGPHGWIWDSNEQIRQKNKEMMDRYRRKAHKAVKKIRTLPLEEKPRFCEFLGFDDTRHPRAVVDIQRGQDEMDDIESLIR